MAIKYVLSDSTEEQKGTVVHLDFRCLWAMKNYDSVIWIMGAKQTST